MAISVFGIVTPLCFAAISCVLHLFRCLQTLRGDSEVRTQEPTQATKEPSEFRGKPCCDRGRPRTDARGSAARLEANLGKRLRKDSVWAPALATALHSFPKAKLSSSASSTGSA